MQMNSLTSSSCLLLPSLMFFSLPLPWFPCSTLATERQSRSPCACFYPGQDEWLCKSGPGCSARRQRRCVWEREGGRYVIWLKQASSHRMHSKTDHCSSDDSFMLRRMLLLHHPRLWCVCEYRDVCKSLIDAKQSCYFSRLVSVPSSVRLSYRRIMKLSQFPLQDLLVPNGSSDSAKGASTQTLCVC